MPMIQLDRADLEVLLRHLERDYLPYDVKTVYNRLWDAFIDQKAHGVNLASEVSPTGLSGAFLRLLREEREALWRLYGRAARG